MKTILFLENGIAGGGSFESLFQLVTNLDRSRFRPIVVFVNETRFLRQLQGKGIDTFLIQDPLYTKRTRSILTSMTSRITRAIEVVIPQLWSMVESFMHDSAITTLRHLIRQNKVDLIHLNDQGIRDLYGALLAYRLGIPCISHLRSDRVGTPSSLKIAFLNKAVRSFIANSSYIKGVWEKFGIDSPKIVVIHNAIDERMITRLPIRHTFSIDNTTRYVLGCVAMFREGKGHSFLLRAFKQFLNQEPSAMLLLVGDGPLREKIEGLVHQLALDDQVRFVGYHHDPQALIAGLDLLILPSSVEPFGRVLLESAVVGTPVVATRVGGIPEIIDNKVNGLLVEYGDNKDLVQAMLTMLHNQEFRTRCVEAGKKIVRERFAIEPHVHAIEQIYDSLCSSGASVH